MDGPFAVGAEDLEDVAKALRFEEDGTKLRRALAKELRDAIDPAVTEAKGRILAMGSAGLSHEGGSLRSAIAGQVKAQTRMSGRQAGVRVRVSRKGMPRDFVNAPKRTNRAAGWRHPVPTHGLEGATQESDTWVHQTGSPGWFDAPMEEHAGEYLAAVQKVIADTADRIKRGAQ